MPNWVDHDLTITGPETELDRFMEECFGENEKGERHFDFDKLIPMPRDTRESTDDGARDADGSIRFPDWYMWRCAHWGTKWNACYTQLTLMGNGSKVIKLSFRTAWSIPWPIYEELAASFPSLMIEGGVSEPMMGFGGNIRCQRGKIEYDDKSEQIKAQMVEFCTETRTPAGYDQKQLNGRDGDDVPF